MVTTDATPPTPPAVRPVWQQWLVYSPLARIVIFVLMAYLFARAVGFLAPLLGLTSGQKLRGDNLPPGMLLVRLIPFVLSYWLLVRFIEKRHIDELAARKFAPHVLAGLVAGTVLFSLIVGLLWAIGSYHVNGINQDVQWLGPILALGVGAGVAEEIMFRGVLFRIVEQGLGTWAALAVSALFFGAVHINNPNATVWSALAIAIEAGLLFGLIYHVTRSLWICMGLHASWNVVQGPVYGIPVSGFDQHGWLASYRTGPDWLTGASFGVEASVVALAACSVITLIFLVIALRRGSIVPPFWARQPAAPPVLP